MDLLGVLRSCLRRWYVFLPILALTAWLCVSQYRSALPQYTATAQVVIAPSPELVYNRGQQSETGLVVVTPFNGGSGAATLAGLLATALNTSTVRTQLLPDGGAALTATRTKEEDDTVVSMTLVAGDAERATGSLQTVRDGVNGVLAGLQRDAGAPEGQLYNAVTAGPVDPPLVAYPDRVRSVVAFGLAGVLLAVVMSVVVQALARSRPQRKQRSPSAPPKVARATSRGRGKPPHGRRGASPLDGAVDLRESPSRTLLP